MPMAGGPACAQSQDQAKSPPAAAETTAAAPAAAPSVAPEASETAVPAPATEASPSTSPDTTPAATEAPLAPEDTFPAAVSPPAAAADPVIAAIKAKLADPAAAKDTHPADLAALTEFYASRDGPPLWVTEMGFSSKGQQILFEIEKAGEWGLDPASFSLPRSDALTATPEAQADAEIALDLAMLKYARYARGGRFTPAKVSALFDQVPPTRDPKAVLAEIVTAEAPDLYLRSLHPKHEQFMRLREALLKTRGQSEEGEQPAADGKDVKRILLNMERWRWMPEELGSTYVLQNSAAFMLYVVKDNKTIYSDKTLVGTIGYATPIFSSPMTTIVFNPDWNAPETVVKENILPALQSKKYSILKTHKLFVSYNGTPVDATKVDWNRVNGLAYTFSQKAGPHNNLGKIKFLFPNRHTVYMHDTLPVRKKYFKQSVRLIGHECVRMEKPEKFASVLLAESNGVTEARVGQLWDGGDNASVALQRKLPVHMVYFTAVVGDDGKVQTFADVYGLDRKLAAAMFGDATGFPEPPPESKEPPPGESDASAPAARRTTADNDIARAMQGLMGD
ncbi:MAG TPA: L,D-transpeptidase family protein [Methyloceanibacter sp.]|nr:L,D-transpeptidase family protein [Methyloceanibacter sp.]